MDDDGSDDDVIWRPAPAGNAAGQDTYCSASSRTHQNWAEGIRLYFSGGEDGVIQGEMDEVVDVWLLCGASVVSNRCECTHMVLDSLLDGVSDRDRLAAEDARWADNSRVGENLSCPRVSIIAYVSSEMESCLARAPCLPPAYQ